MAVYKRGETYWYRFKFGGRHIRQSAQTGNKEAARQIEAARPDLIGLQEVSAWRTGPLGSPPATTVQFDALHSLLDELKKRSLSYAPIAISTNLDAEAPSALGFDVRLTDFDVVLARTDLMTSSLNILDVQTHRFNTNLTFTNPVLGTVTVPRG